MEKNKKLIIAIIVLIAAIVGVSFLAFYQFHKNQEMTELFAIDKQEMENEYSTFATQYDELQVQINNDSLREKLESEKLKTQRLLEELRLVKTTNAAEIMRLKKELKTVRAVLRSYVIEIDSLNRLNQNLTAENTRIKGQYSEATRQIEGLNTERASLSEKVAIAAQLDATGISMQLKNKRGKSTDKTSKTKTVQVNFTIAKNVTAQNGHKTFYVRITTPSGTTLGGGGSFNYQNRTLEATMKKTVEYDGQETSISTFWNVSQSLLEGTYHVSIFADGNMIGSRSFTFK